MGVRGVTGAGKSSLLNYLLGMSILPVSSVEVATATACHISWNYDDTTQNTFKGEAVFRSVEDVVQELDEILTAIKRRKELRERSTVEEGDDEEEDEFSYTITEGIDKWRTVWPFNEVELEKRRMFLLRTSSNPTQALPHASEKHPRSHLRRRKSSP